MLNTVNPLIDWWRPPSPTARLCCSVRWARVLTEKSGSLNLGVEGIMFMGGAHRPRRCVLLRKGRGISQRFCCHPRRHLLCAFLAGGDRLADLQLPDHHAARESERHRSGAVHLRHGHRPVSSASIMRVSENGYISVSNMLKGVLHQNSPFPQGPCRTSPVIGRHPLRQQLLLLPRRCLRRRTVLVPQQDPQRPVPAQRGREPRDRGRRRHQRHAL